MINISDTIINTAKSLEKLTVRKIKSTDSLAIVGYPGANYINTTLYGDMSIFKIGVNKSKIIIDMLVPDKNIVDPFNYWVEVNNTIDLTNMGGFSGSQFMLKTKRGIGG